MCRAGPGDGAAFRERVYQAVARGLSGRQAAKRFKVSPSSVSRWTTRLRETGSVSPDPMGGDHRSGRIESHAEVLLARMAAEPDTTLKEYRAELETKGERFACSSIWRFFDRHQITHKKRPRTPPSGIARM
jgi:transposase